MTDNEIIKALEDEIHLVEYIDGFSADNVSLELLKNTLDLIKRQQAEIEGLKCSLKVTEHLLSEAWKGIEEKDKWFEKREPIVKSEAITEFVERLKRKSELVAPSVYAMPYRAVSVEGIDTLVKEMTEGDK